jgi:hypothetical protein
MVGMTLYICLEWALWCAHLAESLKWDGPQRAVTRWRLVCAVRLSLVADRSNQATITKKSRGRFGVRQRKYQSPLAASETEVDVDMSVDG